MLIFNKLKKQQNHNNYETNHNTYREYATYRK